MNKRIAVLCALIGAVALIAAPAYAEVQNIKISGDITAMALYRENYDLLDSRMAAIDDQVTVINRYVADDADSEFVSVVRLRVDADLTDNVGATVALANLREWDQDRNMDTNAATGAPFNLGLVAASETNQDDASIVLDLAYITLKEMLYSPLTLVIGRQNLAYGRQLIVGDGLWQDPNNSIEYNDLSPLHGYDAVRAILDYDPWTIDLVMAKVIENDDTQNFAWFPATWGADRDSDTDIYGVNVGYVLQGDFQGEVEGYVWYERDENFLMAIGNIANMGANRQAVFDDSETVCAGLRGTYVPIDAMTLGAEVAGQWGEISADDGRRPQNVRGAMDAIERDRQAMLANAFGEYSFSDIRLTPVVGVEYLYTSGEEADQSGDYEAWNALGRGHRMGEIRDMLETLYRTGDTSDTGGFTNQHAVKATCGLDLGELVDGLSVDLAYLHYWFAEDPSLTNQDSDIGDEVDLVVTYDYTEDVQFKLKGAWFAPGDYYDMRHPWIPTQGDMNVGADIQPGGAGQTLCFDDMAVSVVGSCKVSF